MDSRAVARYNLRSRHPNVTLERKLHKNILPRTLALSGHFHLGRFDDHIGWTPLWTIPALCKLRRSGHVTVTTARAACINPRHNLVDLGLTQAAIVTPFARLPLGVPRWHRASGDLDLDGAGPRPHIVVRHKRHRRHLARPVAHGTPGIEDWSNVFRERRLRGFGENRGRDQSCTNDAPDQDVGLHCAIPPHVAAKAMRWILSGNQAYTTAPGTLSSRRPSVAIFQRYVNDPK